MAFLPKRSFGQADEGLQALGYTRQAVSAIGGAAEIASSLTTTGVAATAEAVGVGTGGAMIGVETGAVAAEAGVAAAGVEAGTVATGAVTIGAVAGAIAVVAGYVGIALAVIYIVYSFIMGNQAKVRAYRKLREIKREQRYNIGVDLINAAYGMAIPGWGTLIPQSAGGSTGGGSGYEYYQLGFIYESWSQFTQYQPQYESWRTEMVDFLVSNGLDPTRIVGGKNVKKGENLTLYMFHAIPEEIMLTKEALIGLGYEASMIDSMDTNFCVRMFEMIRAMGRCKTDEQAQAVKQDIENWLAYYSLDPKIFFQGAVPSLPSPTNSAKTIAPQTLSLPGETPVAGEKSYFPILIIGLVMGAITLFSRKRATA